MGGDLSEHGGRHLTEMVIHSIDFEELLNGTSDIGGTIRNQVAGVLHWRVLKCPVSDDVGCRGVEHVSGTVDSTGLLELKGTRIEYVGRQLKSPGFVIGNYTF